MIALDRAKRRAKLEADAGGCRLKLKVCMLKLGASEYQLFGDGLSLGVLHKLRSTA